MQYVQTNKNEYVVHFSTGLVSLNKYSFNFHKILKLLKADAAEELILPLLKTPVLPNGCYYAYEYPEKGFMTYTHVKNDGTTVAHYLNDTSNKTHPTQVLEENLVGVFASVEEIMDEYPEYLL